MIEIRAEEGTTEFRLILKGHAGYGNKGQDIVCAAVSALTYTLINHLDKVTGAYRVDQGEPMKIYAYGTGAMAAYRTIMTGYEMIAEKYPDHVRLTEGDLSIA